jgi:hypothetical protein
MVYDIDFEGGKIPVEIIYHPKNQIKLIVTKHLEVKLYCRKGTPDGIIHSFLLNKTDWIIKHIQKFRKRIELEEVKFTDGSKLRFLGKEYILKFINRAENYVDIFDEFVVIASNKPIDKEIAKNVLTEWLTHKSKEFFPKLIDRYLKELSEYGLTLNSIVIRPMKTRWGTCHKLKKIITLNVYLMQENPAFIEYVVLHEICHLKHANHSKRFYDFVEKFMPDWRERRKMRSRNIDEE